MSAVTENEVTQSIKEAVERYIRGKYRMGFQALETLYMKARDPERDEHGEILHKPNGEIIWKKGPQGEIFEDWGNVEGKDLDAFIASAGMFLIFAGQEAINSKMEATASNYRYQDKSAEIFAQLSGTIKDKEARVTLKTTDEKYDLLYRKTLEERTKDFLDKIDSYIRRIEKIRDMRARDTEREIKLQFRAKGQ